MESKAGDVSFQIQAQHAQKCIEQSVDNLGRRASAPHGWKRENAHQVVQAALQTLDLSIRMCVLLVQLFCTIVGSEPGDRL